MKINTGEKPDADHAPADTVSLNGMRVLLVEDNEMNRESTVGPLSDFGVIVDTADDGDIAVEKVRSSRPGDFDLILMDIRLPRMDGCAATRAIRALENNALSSIPIIALTANAFEEDRRNALAAGMNGHISKPVDISVLISTLSSYRSVTRND